MIRISVLQFLVFLLAVPIALAQNLYQVEGQKVDREFVNSMNSVSALLNSGRYDRALPVVKNLILKNPDIPSLHWDLAKIYYHKGSYQLSYQEAKRATSMAPSSANPYITLGNAALKTGRKQESVKALRTYLSLMPNAANASNVRAFIKSIETELNEESGSSIKSPPGTYLAEATVRGVTHFAAGSMPIKVSVEEDRLRPEVKSAFRLWQKETGGLVQFQFVESAESAQIEVRFSKVRDAGVPAIEGGHTRFRDGVSGRLKAWITIYTQNRGAVLGDLEIKSIALHEIGHALGINGHSDQASDIMFLSLDRSRAGLSARDVATLKALYALKPGLLKTTGE